ncbi:MAG: hypothetical protein Tp152DCM46671_56 [Prokaryotic dsDNA virus sp.]|nr:MAG: hypothetical protein Tp152DCM46671_56 [Prokaryotic dsDNA virus sp.]|tara:strand:- start:44942 stop:46504 length:1563 start_codon:yes stop_codon:yes gene_type:complete
MSDIFNLETYSDTNSSPGASAGDTRYGTGLDTGDLRRKYNFGDRVSELSIAQDPFFRFVSKVSKKPTDDPSFKFTEKRPSWHKRYAYPSAFSNDNATWVEDQSTNATTQYDTYETAGNTVYVKMVSDYLNSGNIASIYGNTNTDVLLGDNGTQPSFFIPGQLVKIPFAASAAGAMGSYAVIKVDSVTLQDESTSPPTAHTHGEAAILKATVVKAKTAGDDYFAGPLGVNAPVGDVTASTSIAGASAGAGLEASRCYVVGSAFEEGSGYPETWKDQPYSTGQGQTQIWKTSCAMTNTARATVLKYEANEWARIWKEKLIEHKYDIEQSLLFGSQSSVDSVNYTQGAVDWISTYGNTFSMALGTKTADDFLNDLSNLLDPRYNNSKANVFFCSTAVYNWLHKLGGYFQNNLEISTNFRADLAVTGRKKVLGLDTTTISTVYGDMNVVRNIHLDGTNIGILGINMKHCAYRPLVGNGLNRDTSVYVGVQTLENSGVDRRVDMILTEAGMQWEMPESHAVWTLS